MIFPDVKEVGDMDFPGMEYHGVSCLDLDPSFVVTAASWGSLKTPPATGPSPLQAARGWPQRVGFAHRVSQAHGEGRRFRFRGVVKSMQGQGLRRTIGRFCDRLFPHHRTCQKILLQVVTNYSDLCRGSEFGRSYQLILPTIEENCPLHPS